MMIASKAVAYLSGEPFRNPKGALKGALMEPLIKPHYEMMLLAALTNNREALKNIFGDKHSSLFFISLRGKEKKKRL